MRVPSIIQRARKAKVEMLRRRHLSPIYGDTVSIAPEHQYHYVINKLPSIPQCGHVHTVGIARYKGVAAINSGTWQSQTELGSAAIGVNRSEYLSSISLIFRSLVVKSSTTGAYCSVISCRCFSVSTTSGMVAIWGC